MDCCKCGLSQAEAELYAAQYRADSPAPEEYYWNLAMDRAIQIIADIKDCRRHAVPSD